MTIISSTTSRILPLHRCYKHSHRILSINRCFSTTVKGDEGRIPFYGEATGADKPRDNISTGTSSNAPIRNARPSSSSSSFIQGNLSPLQKLVVAVHSATTAFSDPTRADAVASLGEVTGHITLTQIYDQMMGDKTGQRILVDKPLVNQSTIDLDSLMTNLNTDTFGYQYAKFMNHHGFDPDERSDVTYISDPELSYIMTRYRQNHDFWHVLTGLPPTVLGELALKWMELLQMGMPVAALSATVGSWTLDNQKEREILWDVYLPWAIRNCVKRREEDLLEDNMAYLMNVYYEEDFEVGLDELRERLNIEPAPDVSL